MATKIGSFLAKLGSKQTVELTKQATDSIKAFFDLAKTIKEKPLDGELLKTVQPYVGQMASLLDVLNSPLGLMVKEVVPFASIAVTLLNLVCEATKKDPTLEECIVALVQAAYLESVKGQLAEDQKLLAQIGEKQFSKPEQVLKFAEVEISDREAKKAITSFPDSDLAHQLSQVLQVRLEDAGMATNKAILFCDRVSWAVPRILIQELAKAADQLKPLADFYRMNGQTVWERLQSLDDYLAREIAPKPSEKVFDEESLTYQDLYVRLKVQLLDQDGNSLKQPPIDLETWVEQQLLDATGQVIFIQGEAGRGKSVFCRMFSDRVRRTLPFSPIVIRLRYLRSLANNLTQTLENYLQNLDFVTSDSSWLTDRNTRFLFLLDGFDELLLEGRSSGGLKEFLTQVEDFQRGSHHRFVITGRPLSLQGIDRVITQSKKLVRVAILPMEDAIRERWLSQWAQHFGTDEVHAFSKFLADCPTEVNNELAREPLLLYLLARLHREKRLDAEMLRTEKKIEAKVRIYDAAVNWVIDKQRENENFRLTGLESDELRRFLTEAALCVVQAGNEFAPIRMLEMRCVRDTNNPIAKLIQKARQETQTDEAKALNSLLTAFYIQPASGDKGGSVEFTHKSFGEFLCAERLKDAIESWTESRGRRNEFYVRTEQLNQEIYDLLGSPVLTVEIVNYLMAMLSRSDQFKPVELFERLNEFYELWCEGTFIDALPDENLPQKKMRLLREHLPEQEKPLGIRQVDVYAGLNVMILLLELHRAAQEREELKEKIVFYPSGQLAEGERYTSRLLKIISYSDCVELVGFSPIVGAFLSYVNLDGANLYSAYFYNANLYSANLYNTYLSSANLDSANLYRANLSRANLSRAALFSAYLSSTNLSSTNLDSANLDSANLDNANLDSANLDSANLYRANLSSAYLYGANLSSAYLGSANLSRANLSRVNLSSANLSSANLSSANLSSANLYNITWNEETNWEGVRGLETARNVPIALKQQLGLE
ncbi:MAG: pentapeptide repeat-containing protein [Leptolyngbya sp. UWPOB_LEPTO1]|uniref:pentapeptide repeat-containing protein n=1 Tax=Leptolyngbya sp. UWPOB_LEPTO1 TaxID=2815653 RepID=UPI001AD41538|nr:pentapeptide repeat-containing protein [Leptolyngbya sp. UWPOB_LEPTO1]MBN8563134.1 pentapeptide repeat-containing protein [Leptolyngbya sp. UWPOB_LEPTO1]